MLAKTEFCNWCEKFLERGGGAMTYHDSRFCSDACRVNYHNAKRKAKRQHEAAISAIMYIQDMMLKQGELRANSIEAMQQIISVAQIPEFDIQCSECGQGRLYIPSAGDICSFCQNNKWTFKPKSLPRKF